MMMMMLMMMMMMMMMRHTQQLLPTILTHIRLMIMTAMVVRGAGVRGGSEGRE